MSTAPQFEVPRTRSSRESYWSPRTGHGRLHVKSVRGGWVDTVEHGPVFEASSGLLTLNLGHLHPSVVAAGTRQINELTFAHPGTFDLGMREELAHALVAYTGLEGFCVLLMGSGTDANECAILLARQFQAEQGFGKRTRILSKTMSYHGASHLCLSLSGHERRRAQYRFLGERPRLPAPDCLRCPVGLNANSCVAECLATLATELESVQEDVAAVIVEPVGGAGGGLVPPPAYFRTLRSLCDAHDVLLISDEIMCGLGRTGRPCAMTALGCRPDLLVVGKGLGAGHAEISAVLVAPRVREVIESGSGITPLTHTYGGNPLATAIGLSVLKAYEAEDVLGNVQRYAEPLCDGLRQIAGRQPVVHDVRGAGYMWMVELHGGAHPGASMTNAAVAAGRERGLLLYPCNGFLPDGTGDGFFVAPPLNSSSSELDYMLSRLGLCLTDIAGKAADLQLGELQQ